MRRAITLPDMEHKRLRLMAAATGRTMSDILRCLVNAEWNIRSKDIPPVTGGSTVNDSKQKETSLEKRR